MLPGTPVIYQNRLHVYHGIRSDYPTHVSCYCPVTRKLVIIHGDHIQLVDGTPVSVNSIALYKWDKLIPDYVLIDQDFHVAIVFDNRHKKVEGHNLRDTNQSQIEAALSLYKAYLRQQEIKSHI